MKNNKKKTKLQLAQEEAQISINKTNEKISELGKCASTLNSTLNDIQAQFDNN